MIPNNDIRYICIYFNNKKINHKIQLKYNNIIVKNVNAYTSQYNLTINFLLIIHTILIELNMK